MNALMVVNALQLAFYFEFLQQIRRRSQQRM